MNFIEKLKIIFRLNNFGKLPLCNLKSHRAPHIGGFCFPLCWRCSCLTLGYIVGMSLRLCGVIHISNLIVSVMLISPTIIDGTLQYFWGVESNNVRRIATGFISGVGIGSLNV